MLLDVFEIPLDVFDMPPDVLTCCRMQMTNLNDQTEQQSGSPQSGPLPTRVLRYWRSFSCSVSLLCFSALFLCSVSLLSFFALFLCYPFFHSLSITLSVTHTIIRPHTLTITCTCCCDEIKGIQDQDLCSFSFSFSFSVSRWVSKFTLQVTSAYD